MAPLDHEQKAEVADMMRTGMNEMKAAVQKGHVDMRVTTEAEIGTQRIHNAEVENKFVEITQSIGAQFTALRAELSAEFDSTKKNVTEVPTLVSGLQEQKQNMLTGIEKHFKEFAVKIGEMAGKLLLPIGNSLVG